MPSKKTPNGEFKDIAHPINPETRALFEEAILEAYKTAEYYEYIQSLLTSLKILFNKLCSHPSSLIFTPSY